jgi:acid phosphatase (class A)
LENRHELALESQPLSVLSETGAFGKACCKGGMKMIANRHSLLSFACCLLLAVTILDSPHARAAEQTYTYIAPETLPPQLLAPPPKEGSAAWRQEIDSVLTAQKSISRADLAALRDEQHLRFDLMTAVIGPDFTPQRFPKSFALLDHVLRDAGGVTEADKQFWHTRRPYLTDARVKLLVNPVDASPAYPSGHTSETRVLAEILGLLYPQKLEALRTRAAAIARHRVEAGVHYPFDVTGGECLAMLILGALLDNDAFQEDLGAARQEIAAGG